MSAPSRLSVIIPTFNRAEMLGDTLADLDAQRGVDGRLEVVVIDDGSTDDTPDVVGSAGAGFAHELVSVRQANAGLNAGRNHGARRASHDLLAYLDDDVALPSDWAASMLAGFETNPEADGVAGRIVLRFEAEPPAWLTPRLHHYLSSLDLGDQPRWLVDGHTPVGACFGLRRSAWDRLGGFHPLLDRRGTSLLSNGEKELFCRMHASGGRSIYWPAAHVEHRVHPERLTPEWFRRRATAQGIGDALLMLDGDRSPTVARRSAWVAREAVRALRSAPVLLRGVVSGDGPVNADLWLRYCVARGRTFIRPPLGDVRGEPTTGEVVP